MRGAAAHIVSEVERVLGGGPDRKGKEWPAPMPLQSELPPVDTMHEDLLPSSFRALVRDVADWMQIPIDYPAAVIVLSLAGAVNRRARIQPKANDTSWLVVPNLWAPSSRRRGF